MWKRRGPWEKAVSRGKPSGTPKVEKKRGAITSLTRLEKDGGDLKLVGKKENRKGTLKGKRENYS